MSSGSFTTRLTRALRVLRTAIGRPWWLAALLLTWLTLAPPAAVQRLDLLAYDLTSAIAVPTVAPDSVIVAIDERSLQALGRWPWKRSVHADLLARLHEAGVRSVAYDVLFSDHSPADGADDDRRLAQAIAAHGRVILPVAPTMGVTGIRALAPLPELTAASAALGHVDVELDVDSVARRLFMHAGMGDRTWDALPLALQRLQVAADGNADPPQVGAVAVLDALTALRARGLALARGLVEPHAVLADTISHGWRRDTERMLPSHGARVPVLSFVDVLDDRAVAATLQDRAVLVGVTVEGLGDRFSAAAAPGRQHWSGVQWHAQVYEALRAARLVTPLPDAWSWLLGTTVLALMAAGARLRPGLRGPTMLTLLLAPTLVVGALLLFFSAWVDVTAPTLAGAVCLLIWRAGIYRRMRRTLDRVRGRSDAALRAIADSVIVVDPDGLVADLNPVAARLAGTTPERARGRAASSLFAMDETDRRRLDDAVGECLRVREPVRHSAALRAKTAEGERSLRLCVGPVMDGPRAMRGAVVALNDVTDVISAERRLQFEATHDPLTGLPNRVLLVDRLGHAIASALRSGGAVAVLFLDLDRFKRINDSLGHRLGDTVLKTIAERLVNTCRASDTVARWGGDEFVIVLEDVADDEAASIVAGNLVKTVSEEVAVDGIEVQTSCSIGIALAPQNGTSVDDLLAMADAAMYRGKSRAGQCFEFYSTDMNVGSRAGLALETRLRMALGRGEFEVHYQPQVRVQDGQPVGLEALLRWRLDNGELLRPGQFIDVAEEMGLILPIGTWVLQQVSRQIAQWRAEDIPVPTVSVNVSARQCLDRSLVRQVDGILCETGIPAASLMLEITETTAMRDLPHVASLLRELRTLGVGVALDDFGTGYSSLAHLKCLPIDQIKIDQSFVRDITTDANDEAIVRATIALARGLRVPVLAEGVETAEQARSLAEHGCDLAQGYLYARPMDAAQVASLLKSGLTRGLPQYESGRVVH